MAGKYRQWFKHEFAMAELVLKNAGGQLQWSQNDYEAFRFVAPRVCIIFYPHKTSGTGNVSCRVRDAGSQDKNKAKRLMNQLYVGAGHNNTFSQNNQGHFGAHDWARQTGTKFGWADEEATR